MLRTFRTIQMKLSVRYLQKSTTNGEMNSESNYFGGWVWYAAVGIHRKHPKANGKYWWASDSLAHYEQVCRIRAQGFLFGLRLQGSDGEGVFSKLSGIEYGFHCGS